MLTSKNHPTNALYLPTIPVDTPEVNTDQKQC